jgi:hypothetical protein
LHLNGEGKRLMARQIVREIRQITVEEINSRVSLDQKGKIGRNFADSRRDKLEVQGNYIFQLVLELMKNRQNKC